MLNNIESLVQENPLIAGITATAAVALTIYFSCYRKNSAQLQNEKISDNSLSDRMKALHDADRYSKTGIKPT
jgi:hypothetical protein